MIHTLEADSLRFETGRRVILSDVYLKCETGQITGLLGRNGTGESSLMKIVFGSLDAEKSVRFDKAALPVAFTQPDVLRYLPQFSFTPSGLTLGRLFQDFETDFAGFENRFPEFRSRAGTRIRHLSGGERRFVELYAILMSESHFALLDEPFTFLNPLQTEKAKELILEAKARKGLLITDHLYRHVTSLSDRLYVLSNGKTHTVRSLGDLEELGYVHL